MKKEKQWLYIIGSILGLVLIDYGTKYLATVSLDAFDGGLFFASGKIIGLAIAINIQDPSTLNIEFFLGALAILLIWSTNLPIIPLVLLTAGGIGNLSEMMLTGGNIDFLAFKISSNTIYIANVADFYLWSSVKKQVFNYNNNSATRH